MNIAVFGNSYQEKYKSQLGEFLHSLPHAHEVTIERKFASYLRHVGVDTAGAGEFDVDTFAGAELAVSIGGDGTLLSKAALLARTATPVVGINTGK